MTFVAGGGAEKELAIFPEREREDLLPGAGG
jgi:hypothetical protein